MHVTIEAAMKAGIESFIQEYDGHLTDMKETPEGVVYYDTNL